MGEPSGYPQESTTNQGWGKLPHVKPQRRYGLDNYLCVLASWRENLTFRLSGQNKLHWLGERLPAAII